MHDRVALVILDGRGMTTELEKSATAQAKTPFIDSLYTTVPRSELEASEEAVGLPKGQVGNSEVGHSTLGTGRVNYQHLVRISKSIEDRSFFYHRALLDAIKYAKKNNKAMHLVGLISDGGVHSHIQHLFACIELLYSHDQAFFVHAITDGRDTDPESGLGFVTQLQEKLQGTKGVLSSLIGRYFAMDRDQRRERVKQAYDLYTMGIGDYNTDPIQALKYSYASGVTDEFLPPIRCVEHGGIMQEGDVVLCFNFRSDRARELTSCLTQQAYPEQGMKPLALHYVCMTEYDARFKDVSILFPSISLDHCLGSVLSDAGKTQLRIAETEKYPHVSFFFNAGREDSYVGEHRIMIPSPKVATYNLQPAMSAQAITDACIEHVRAEHPDFICLNYANPDMVGHTGVFDAVVQACEVVDSCAETLCKELIEHGYTIIMLADHGNADMMTNDDGSPNTAHSLAKVPCFLIHAGNGVQLHDGSLADIAPTILALMAIEQPSVMTGRSLLK